MPQGLAYVDAFAGRGRYAYGEAGSPLLIVSTVFGAMDSRRIKASHVTFHFVEKDPANFYNLEQELATYAPAQDLRVKVALYQAPFSVASDQIITMMRVITNLPFSSWILLATATRPWLCSKTFWHCPRPRSMVNLMYDFASRAVSMRDEALSRTLDGLFGTTAWRALAPLTGEERERALLELYRSQLKSGHARYVLPFRMGDDERDRTLYYLLHATKHIKGAQVMKDAMIASGTPGGLGYAGAARHRLTPLFDVDAAHLPAKLLEWFSGETLTFDEIVARTFERTGTCKEKDYRACLKELEQTSQIAVERVTSSTARGLGGNDRITFLQTNTSAQGTLFHL